MSLLYSSDSLTDQDRHNAVAELLKNTRYDRDFYVLLLGAILLAIGGIFTDSIAVLIASMIVAPLAYPLLGLGMGLVAGDWRGVGRSIFILIVACFISLGAAVAITLLFGELSVKDVYITFTSNRVIAVAVALVAGAIGAYGLLRPRVATAIVGVAIAVSLMPPLVATGTNIATGDYDVATDAFILFLLNVGGIVVSSVIVFALAKVRSAYKQAVAE